LEYHKNMRRWFVIVMLFLLPLRGLVGDAMAYSMLPDAGQLQQVAQLAAQPTAIQVLPSHAAFGEHAMPCHTSATKSPVTDKSQCSNCQVCHLAVTLPLASPEALAPMPYAKPVQSPVQWHSAEARLLAKTPIV
jgi:hypothetical protein